ncbi:thiol-disulfide isomerase/thioredoxin [Stakelama pacifica]|uniref:Thiol-disulfide isomerase/thioredoxin n=3 Tax=Stakelama pacifica TaxID=517720 RepID=A0A4R6FY96_9SPHN|nr:thiol-disulfide isomerase/thioredoxin [Stakelama pacifica]
MLMVRWVIISFMAMLAGAAGAAPVRNMPSIGLAKPVAGGVATVPRPAVVMLWASWCASCKVELRRFSELQEAAAPLPLVTLAIDPAPTAKEALVSAGMTLRGAFADGRPAEQVLADWGGGLLSLPLAVAIDREGRVCGRKHGLLGTNQLREWAVSCSK